jgi:hypothetical protein
MSDAQTNDPRSIPLETITIGEAAHLLGISREQVEQLATEFGLVDGLAVVNGKLESLLRSSRVHGLAFARKARALKIGGTAAGGKRMRSIRAKVTNRTRRPEQMPGARTGGLTEAEQTLYDSDPALLTTARRIAEEGGYTRGSVISAMVDAIRLGNRQALAETRAEIRKQAAEVPALTFESLMSEVRRQRGIGIQESPEFDALLAEVRGGRR